MLTELEEALLKYGGHLRYCKVFKVVPLLPGETHSFDRAN